MRRFYTGAGWITTPEPLHNSHDLYRFQTLNADSILVDNDTITWVGRAGDAPEHADAEIIQLNGMGVTPGLIDFHAHPVFADTREEEFQLRTQGVTYAEIAAAGGGILNSVKKLRATDERVLVERTRNYLDNALAYGTTTMEAKSGYGLQPEAEYKMLRVIRSLNDSHAIDLIPTFLGAHEFPPEYREDHEGYIQLLINEMIPEIASKNLAESCDIFCETGVYSLEDTKRILSAAKKHGLKVKVHADQLTPLGGTVLASELNALSSDHLEFIDDAGIAALQKSGTVAGLLPLASHFLRMPEDPPVRKMIDAGVTCALATDFNPGSAMCESMQMVIHFAVIRFRITAEEAFWMATAGSAKALELTDRGWLGDGALADFVVWNARNLQIIPYHFGVNLAQMVVKRGEVVVRNG